MKICLCTNISFNNTNYFYNLWFFSWKSNHNGDSLQQQQQQQQFIYHLILQYMLVYISRLTSFSCASWSVCSSCNFLANISSSCSRLRSSAYNTWHLKVSSLSTFYENIIHKHFYSCILMDLAQQQISESFKAGHPNREVASQTNQIQRW